MAFALLGACALALALDARTEVDDVSRGGGRPGAGYGGALATSIARAEPPRSNALAAPPPQPAELHAAIEPTAAAPARPAPRELSRAEQDQVRRLVKRGHRYVRAKRYATAALAYSKALALDSSHVIALRAIVRVHLRERNADEALRWAERLVELEPDSSVSQRLLGDAQELTRAPSRGAR